MIKLASHCRTIGLLLIAMGILSLVSAGGSFRHAHEIAFVSHDRPSVDGADHHHHKDPSSIQSDGVLHCGASILAMTAIDWELPDCAKTTLNWSTISNLVAQILPPDAPPPRNA